MSTLQLRRYQLEPGRSGDFTAWFPSLLPVRRQYGFQVLVAVSDTERDTFTWVVRHDGDEEAFRSAEVTYNDSPERAAAFESFPRCIVSTEVGFVTDVLAG